MRIHPREESRCELCRREATAEGTAFRPGLRPHWEPLRAASAVVGGPVAPEAEAKLLALPQRFPRGGRNKSSLGEEVGRR